MSLLYTGGATDHIDATDPIERLRPLNQGLIALFAAPAGYSGGSKLPDLTRLGDASKHGTLENAPRWLTADTGFGALAFDGATSGQKAHVTGGVWFDPANAFSLAARVFLRSYATGQNNAIIDFAASSGNNFTWQVAEPGGGGTWFVATDGMAWSQTISGAEVPSLGVWHHLALTQDGAGNYAWYIDGSLAKSFSNQHNAGTIGNVFIGARVSGAAGTMDALISDAWVWNRLVTATDIFGLSALSKRSYDGLIRRVRSRSFGVSTGIAFDAASNSGYQAASSGYSWSHTCTGTDRFLAVDVSRLSVPGTTVTGVTYNGVALTQVGVTSTGTDAGQVSMWGLINPASGSNTIAVALSAVCISSGTAVSYTGVNQTTATEAYNGATATNVGAADATVTVTTVADQDWVHAAVATDDTTVTAGQTSRNNVSGAGGSGANEDTGPLAASSAQAMTYAVSALGTWVIGGYGIRPVGAAGSQTATPGVATVTITGVAPTASGSGTGTATPGTATVTVTGVAPAVAGTGTGAATAGVATVTVSGIAPAASGSGTGTATPGTATVTVSGVAPSAAGSGSVTATPGVATVTISGTDAAATGDILAATPGFATVTITGIAPAASGSGTGVATPGVATLTITGIAPAATPSGSAAVTPWVAVVTITGEAPAASPVATTATAGFAVVTVTGVAPAATLSYLLATPGVAVVTITGAAPTVTGGSGVTGGSVGGRIRLADRVGGTVGLRGS